MAYIQKAQILITSSTDKTMRLWRFDKARSLLQYPWFVEYQRVHELKSIHSSQMDNSVWLSCFDQRVGEKLQIYAGDSEGSVYLFEPVQKEENDQDEEWDDQQDRLFRLLVKQERVHRNGVIQILLVPQENLIFTISYDQTLKWFEATERA